MLRLHRWTDSLLMVGIRAKRDVLDFDAGRPVAGDDAGNMVDRNHHSMDGYENEFNTNKVSNIL